MCIIIDIMKEIIRIQDAGCRKTDDLRVPVYHIHGKRQYYGTCKFHVRKDCFRLLKWKPPTKLSKTIMREWEKSLESIPISMRCKSCWPKGLI